MSAARTTSSKGASKPKAKAKPKPKVKAKAKPTVVADTPSRQPMRRTIRGGRPYFFADPAIDKLLNMLVVLGSEVWTLRERLAALEAIQIRQGGLAAGELDAHEFSAEDEARLAAERKEVIDSLFRILQEQVEEARRR
ncbi:MAG: hypothetical protein ACKOGN_00980 [Gammaproteobacteria bacterium]